MSQLTDQEPPHSSNDPADLAVNRAAADGAAADGAAANGAAANGAAGAWMRDLGLVMRGMCMGAADVIPGVSGGTVALILGIYHRLVTAISHFDMKFVGYARRRQWRRALEHADLRFLALLGCGIGGGFLLMTLVVNRLLNSPTTLPYLLAAFFGMILGSAILVGRMIHYRSLAELAQVVVLGLLGAGFAYWTTTLTTSAQDPSLLFLFCCGLIATCAMILPGISGAMILLILGVYGHLTDIPHQLLRGENVVHGITTILVFGTGCAISLISVSKVLRWLLVRHQAHTMGLLCGLMFGALAKLWPFQNDLTPELPFKEKILQPKWPEAWDAWTFSVLAVLVISMVAIVVIDWLIRRSRTAPSGDASSGDGDGRSSIENV